MKAAPMLNHKYLPHVLTHFKKNLDTILDKNFLGLGLWLGSGHLLASAFLSDVVRPSFVGGCARRTTRTAFRGWARVRALSYGFGVRGASTIGLS